MPIATLSLASFGLSSCSEKHEPVKPQSDFIGFEGNRITFDNEVDEDFTSVNIRKISDNVYENETPIDIYTLKSFTYDFRILTRNPGVSTRAKFFLNSSVKNHGISIFGNRGGEEYIETLPDIQASDPRMTYDKVFVNFECDDNIFLVINFRVLDFTYADVMLSYQKTDPKDKKNVWRDDLTSFHGTIECPEKKLTEDFSEQFTLTCRKGYYQKINLAFNIIFSGTGKDIDPLLRPAFTMTVIPQKQYDDFGEYYTLDLSYFFLASSMPPKEKCPKGEPFLCRLNVFEANDLSKPISWCDFYLLWI